MVQKVIIITFMILLIVASAWSFSSESGKIEVDTTSDNVYIKITTTGVAMAVVREPRKGWMTKPGQIHKKSGFLLQGSGFVVAQGYIVTAAHVVDPDEIVVKTSRYSRTYGRVSKVLNRVITITSSTNLADQKGSTSATIEYIDRESDIAVLSYELPNNILEPIPYKIEMTLAKSIRMSLLTFDRLHVGNAVAVVVRSRDKDEAWSNYGIEVRYGKIISRNIDESVSREDAIWYSPQDFSASLMLYPGDSGSPVFAFNHGEPVLIGVARAIKPEGKVITTRPKEPRCYIARIDRAKAFINAVTN